LRRSALPREARHQFDMRGVAELVDWRDALDLVAAVDQDPGIARERRDIAGYRNHRGYPAGGELGHLRLRALTRRVEHHRIVIAQFLRHQRPAKQVARFRLDRLQSGRRGRCLL
jgi:hypothetical protein